MSYKTTTAVVESVDSCRVRSTSDNNVETAFFVSGTENHLEGLSELKQAKKLDTKSLSELCRFDVIFIDTCELMSSGLENFLKLNAVAFRIKEIKLSITPSVMMELFRNCSHRDETARQNALRGWHLIVSPEFKDLFITYPPVSTITHADPNIVNAVCSIKLHNEKNVLVLTSDKKLTSSIFNTCCIDSVIRIGGCVQVLYIDKASAELTRYHKSRLENLLSTVSVPEWHIIGALSLQSEAQNYFRDCIANGTVFMDSSALKYAFNPDCRTPFLENLHKLNALRSDQKIIVLSSSLYDPQIRDAVKSLPHIFTIIEPLNPELREKDALLFEINSARTISNDLHILLISNNPSRYGYIVNGLPTCHRGKEFWGCFIDTRNGLLCKSSRSNGKSSISA